MVFHGSKNVTTAGTSVTLVTDAGTATLQEVDRLTIQAKSTNTNRVYVGIGAASSANHGRSLGAGETMVIENGVSLQTVYLDAVTNGEGVVYVAEAR